MYYLSKMGHNLVNVGHCYHFCCIRGTIPLYHKYKHFQPNDNSIKNQCNVTCLFYFQIIFECSCHRVVGRIFIIRIPKR